MSDGKKTAVRFYKKRNVQREKVSFSHIEIQMIRKWLITGSFNNSFFLNESFDKTRIDLVKKVIQFAPERIEELIEETFPLKLNHSTFIYTLVLLSAGPFRAKRIFKSEFDRIIRTPKHLYKFMELCKKERGFGKVIHEAIHNWFKHHDASRLEKMFVRERAGSNWKAQDIMRLMKPKPTDKKEQLLFKWLAKDHIDENELSDYTENFPMIVAYEKMRHGQGTKKIVLNAIEELKFTNDMIPGNVYRDEDVIFSLFNKEEHPMMINSRKVYPLIPRYIDKLNGHVTELVSFYRNRKLKVGLNIITLLMVYSQMKRKAFQGEEMELLDFSEEQLLEIIKKTYNPSIHIVDTGEHMFAEELNNIATTPAVASSVIIGMSKNVFDLDGNRFHRKDPRSILEAEGYVRKYKRPDFKKIFEAIEDIDENVMFVWTNDRNFPKDLFNKKFTQWRLDSGKQMKLVFINLTDKKITMNNKFKEIYGLDKKTMMLLKHIKNGVV